MINKKRKLINANGTTAAALVAYQYSEVCAIYPISPSSNISENMDIYSAKGLKNALGNKVKIIEMQSEAGAAGAVHGILQTGVLSGTFTASQGLLLMIPNIYKMRGEMLPGVFYVASRTIATRSLSIYCDHQDIYAVRVTGAPIMVCNSVQEILDLSPVAHAVALRASTPIINFFDGFRTGHESQKVEEYSEAEYKQFIDQKALKHFRNRSMSPLSPDARGSAEDEQTCFQGLEAQNSQTEDIVNVFVEECAKVTKLTGRKYAPFIYHGAKNPKYVIVAMASACEVIEGAIDQLNRTNAEYGLIKIHLFRPFSQKHLLQVLPKSTKRIAVLDRGKEYGAIGEPLFGDISTFHSQNMDKFNIELIIGGRYGISSKDFSPAMVKSVFDHLVSKNPFHSFSVGIDDDLNHTSIPIDENFIIKNNEHSFLLWGLAGDGMVSTGANIFNFIANNTEKHAQVYVTNDSRKAGGITKSYLRISDNPIKAPYYAPDNELIMCSNYNFVFTITKLISTLKENGKFLLNTYMSPEEISEALPNRIKKQLATKKAKFYVIDANKLAYSVGLGTRTNTILQIAWLKLTYDAKDFEVYKKSLKDIVEKRFSKKGKEIVELNFKAMDSVDDSQIKNVVVDPEWANLKVNATKYNLKELEYEEFVDIMDKLEGDMIPVSFFAKEFNNKNLIDGKMLNDVTFNLKGQKAVMVPKWNPENCIQCAQCSFYCPHATIRAFQLSDDEIKNAPMEFDTLEQTNPNNRKYRFRIHIDAENCVGCGLCSQVCPGKGPNKKALTMVPAHEVAWKYDKLTNYIFKNVEYRTEGYSTDTIKGAALLYPYFEASGACAGCGEAPYYRLLTQLFGQDLVIANATGCTSIYCGVYPYSPFATNKQGQGPSWANSLFEDNAEFGYGMTNASRYKWLILREAIAKYIDKAEPEFKPILKKYLTLSYDDREKQREIRDKLLTCAKKTKVKGLKVIEDLADVLVKKSHWFIGGDGWAYDIGYGGIDHAIASGEDLNILVLDTEVYSNTGGQKSKASPLASVEKFAFAGKDVTKKDIGLILTQYDNVYVAKIAMGMNPMQTIRALKEAESFPGPSIVICYCPCIEHGIKGGMSFQRQHSMEAVLTGYWQIWRYDPRLLNEDKNPFQLDYKTPNFDNLNTFLMKENRFAILKKNNPENADLLLKKLRTSSEKTFNKLKFLSENKAW